jgi:type IV pilus assembly protein PilX
MYPPSHRRPSAPRGRRRDAGIVLVSSLLLLLVVTIMALSMFRSFGLQEKIAGNVREKQRALQVAMSTEEYAEWWLVNESNAVFALANGDATVVDVACTNPGTIGIVAPANEVTTTGGQICQNSLTSLSGAGVTAWPTGAPAIGVGYEPPNMNFTNAAGSDYYPVAQAPRFYIQDLGSDAIGNGEVYQIDAYGYGLSATGVAVVESTFAITCATCGKMGP